MPRYERAVALDVDGRGARPSSTGGRFSFGLYLRIRGPAADEVIAWLPTTSRKSPPRFVGRIEARGTSTVLQGTIRETRFEARQKWIWGSLAVLCFIIAGGMAVALARGAAGAWLGVAGFGAVALCFAALARSMARHREHSFNSDANDLERRLRVWSSAPSSVS